MAPRQLKVLIIGGGIAGPAVAYWLSQFAKDCAVDITIAEWSASLRASGSQIDVRGQGLTVLRKMGLEGDVSRQKVHETGVKLVDSESRVRAYIAAGAGEKRKRGRQGLTSDYEIMRGDMVHIMHNAVKNLPGVRYLFGVLVTGITQDASSPDKVTVTFKDEKHPVQQYDVVVGADGQNSGTRKMILASTPAARDVSATDFCFEPLGFYVSLFSIPRAASDTDDLVAHHVEGGTMLAAMRGDEYDIKQGYLVVKTDHPVAGDMDEAMRTHAPAETMKALFAKAFEGYHGWEVDRLLAGMRVADDFYTAKIGQVKVARWHSGRVVLVGDAAHCPGLVTGWGTSSALVGAYVLAGELGKKVAQAKREGAAVVDVRGALREYDVGKPDLRDLIMTVQKVPKLGLLSMFPKTKRGLWFFYTFMWCLTSLRILKLIYKLNSDDMPGWQLPEYEELGDNGREKKM